ncbi:transcription antitermination factor NusB [Haloferula sargassicola]|uniref:Transcription antitermination protein NusB n=1 Tax=Haloferula sargassicola TaxID=490096 RepID=A0ABP9UNE0_9BACT
MPSRRQIRRTAIQFLYCADLEGGDDPAQVREAFWQFVTESDRRAIILATRKTIQHLNIGREERRDEFTTRLPAALATLRADPDLEDQAAQLQRIADLENEWDSVMAALSRQPQDDEDEAVVSRFTPLVDRLFLINRQLIAARNELSRILLDFPGLRARLEPVLGSIKRLDRVSARLSMIEKPEDFPDHAELTRIRESRAELRELQESVDHLVDRVLARKEEIDRMLERVIENFAPERVDPIDRAILRLGTLEVRFDDNVPMPVAINEAIELARQFGTTDSPRFVNGILDRIAKG